MTRSRIRTIVRALVASALILAVWLTIHAALAAGWPCLLLGALLMIGLVLHDRRQTSSVPAALGSSA